MGRGSAGEFRALTPRYLVVSSFFWIATGNLLFLVARQFARTSTAPAAARVRLAGAAALGAAVAWQVPNWRLGSHFCEVWARARWQAQALVMFIELFPGEQGTATRNVLDKSHAYALESVRTLRRLGLLDTPVLEKPDLDAFELTADPLAPRLAAVEAATVGPGGALHLAGHARFGVGRPADLVLFVIDAGSGHRRVVGIGQPLFTPAWRGYVLDYEFANAEPIPQSAGHRWRGTLAPAQVPRGRVELELWALDAKSRRVTRLDGSLQLVNDENALRLEGPLPPLEAGP
jgi:hypothetical protein